MRWRAAAAAVFAACVFLHQPVTDLCDVLARRYGFFAYDHAAGVVFLVAGALTAGVLGFGRGRSAATWTALAAGAALAATAQRVLILNSVENVHFPQYAVIAMLLGRSGLATDTSWLAATLLGVADEEYQYLFLRAGRPNPLDWNDISLNAIGALLGVAMLLHFGWARARASAWSWRRIVAVVVPLAAASWWLVPPVWTPFYKVVGSGFRSHVLTPGEGLIVVGAIWLGVRSAVVHAARGRTGRLARNR